MARTLTADEKRQMKLDRTLNGLEVRREEINSMRDDRGRVVEDIEELFVYMVDYLNQ